jgi:transcriptional regulator
MLIHPWDDAISETEWRDWLAAGHDFGQLVVNDPDNSAPHVIPTHFAVDGDTLLVHLARPNKVWAAIQARPIVVMSVVDNYATSRRRGAQRLADQTRTGCQPVTTPPSS